MSSSSSFSSARSNLSANMAYEIEEELLESERRLTSMNQLPTKFGWQSLIAEESKTTKE